MKVGILTHYYKSENYGGNLQAWALCRIIGKLGHEVEQISLDRTKGKGMVRFFKRTVRKIQACFKNKKIKNNLKIRKKAFWEFNDGEIPHSKAYTEKNIYKCIDNYDAFVTGSDQVWHPLACCDAYLLKFVPSAKIKMSYSASIACDILSEEYKQTLSKALEDYRAISVREENAKELVGALTNKEVVRSLDPTLLLTKDEWDEISVPVNIEGNYIFCYFLGDDEAQRDLITNYAREKGLKIVTLPHLLGAYRSCDENFGDYKLYDACPKMFVSLIKNAKCVFTDSFHTTVFSLIFEKEHFVFSRKGYEGMGSRIYTLTQMFDTQDHFCDTEEKMTLEYINDLSSIDYSKQNIKYEQAKTESLEYLKNNLL